MTAPVVGYAGLTHLGICSAVGVATRGCRVVGFSEDPELVARIGAGRLPIVEPGLDAAFLANRANLSFTADPRDLANCHVVYVAVDVPTDENGSSDLSAIEAMVDRVSPRLDPQAILVMLSQVPPGFTRKLRYDVRRRYYQVETLIFGQALERATQPERIIVGCADPAAPLPEAYRALLEKFGCPVLTMRYESAELTKIAINCFLVATVSTTNTLAELAESLEADWAEIAPALRLDARIGPAAYLTPGLGIAGGNLERDLATVVRLAGVHQSSSGVIDAYLDNSRHMKDWAYRIIKREVLDKLPSPRLGILGLAYKQDTGSTKNSPALALIERLSSVQLAAHDPAVPETEVAGVRRTARAEDVATGADALLLMTPWAQYRDLDPAALASRMKGRIVVDPYRVLDAARATAAGLTLFSIGRTPVRPGKD